MTYKRIYCNAKAGGDLWTCLPRARRKRRRRCPRQAGRGRGKIPNQRMIDTRPAEVETRKRVGHWEGDLINGARETGHLSTLVERCTRYTLIDRTDSKEALEVTGALCGLFGQLPPSARLSLTLDNASGQIENSHWCLIQKRFKIPGLGWKLEHADSMLAPRVARKKSTMDAFCQ